MKTTLDELLTRINILDVVSEFVTLRRAGKNYVGLCPFHKEKTPSFSVSTEKQIYYCFGCREGGNAVNFLMKYENLTFQEALEGLARKYGIEIERRGMTKRATVFDALSKLAEYYKRNLQNSGAAMRYLLDRGIDQKTIEEFGIGFSERSRSRIKNFIKEAGISSDILLGTGILRVKDGETYDILGGRVVIPILDPNRRIIGFGGRALEKEGFPKYINSPESSVFAKRQALFGIDKTKKSIVEKNEAIIVEGYFDCISLYCGGLRNIVSTLGTSVTEDQLMRLRNYTENITLMLDGDEAGIRSALKMITIFSEMDINGNMVVLPEGHDPDSFIRHEGIEGVERVLGRKKPILDYFFEYHMEGCGLQKLEGKMAFLRKVIPHIEEIRDGIKKRLYIKRLSELTGVEESHFWDTAKDKNGECKEGGVSSPSIIGSRVIGALISNPDLLSLFVRNKEVMNYIRQQDMREILSRMCDYYDDKGCLEVQGFIDGLDRKEQREFVLKSVFDDIEPDKGELERVVWDYVRHVRRESVLEKARNITERLLDAEKRGDENAITELLDQKRQVLAIMKSSLIK